MLRLWSAIQQELDTLPLPEAEEGYGWRKPSVSFVGSYGPVVLRDLCSPGDHLTPELLKSGLTQFARYTEAHSETDNDARLLADLFLLSRQDAAVWLLKEANYRRQLGPRYRIVQLARLLRAIADYLYLDVEDDVDTCLVSFGGRQYGVKEGELIAAAESIAELSQFRTHRRLTTLADGISYRTDESTAGRVLQQIHLRGGHSGMLHALRCGVLVFPQLYTTLQVYVQERKIYGNINRLPRGHEVWRRFDSDLERALASRRGASDKQFEVSDD